MMTALITSKGQVTIPIALRRKLGMHAGQVIEFDAEAPFLKATKPVNLKQMRASLGSLKKELRGPDAMEWLEETRGPVRLPRRKE